MKKNGFTLAEVLISVGVLGVIAALTIPALKSDSVTAQVGPRLSKAVGMFEQASKAVLNDRGVDTLRETGWFDDNGGDSYRDALRDHLKVANLDYNASWAPSGGSNCTGYDLRGNNRSYLLASDGTIYGLEFDSDANPALPANQEKIGTVSIDINGKSSPNQYGTDVFAFIIFNDGSLAPAGSSVGQYSGNCSWKDLCPIGEIPENTVACAGHIFENNMRVLYK